MASGFKWSFVGTFAQGILQIGVTMTMARLLAPADYGLYAMVEVVLRWAGLFGQTGLITVLVQKPSLDEIELKAARTLALGLAVVSALVIVSAAPLIAAGFDNQAVVPLLRVASLSFLFNGLGLTSLAMLRRRMQFGRLSLAEIGGYILGNAVTAITLARHGYGVWSVVIGSLVGQIAQNLLAVLQARLDFGFSFQRRSLQTLARQGAHVSVNSCLDVLSNTMDTFVIARVMPQAILGIYNRATMLATLPTNFIWTAISRVTFPGYSRLQHEPQTLAAFFHRTQRWSGTLSVAVPLSMIPAADTIVRFLLGDAWIGAIPILRLLLLAFACESLAFPYHSALDALGCYSARTRIRFTVIVVRACCLALLVTTHRDWIFATGSVAALSTWLISVAPFARKIGEPVSRCFRHDFAIAGRALLCAAAVAAARFGLGPLHLPVYLELAGCVLAGGAMLAFVLRAEIAALRRPA